MKEGGRKLFEINYDVQSCPIIFTRMKIMFNIYRVLHFSDSKSPPSTNEIYKTGKILNILLTSGTMVSLALFGVITTFSIGVEAEAFSNKWNFQSNNAFNNKIKVVAGNLFK